ncbi:MAG: hypothetical protein ACC631_08695 [Halocynthiibacter sp.]
MVVCLIHPGQAIQKKENGGSAAVFILALRHKTEIIGPALMPGQQKRNVECRVVRTPGEFFLSLQSRKNLMLTCAVSGQTNAP